MIRSRVKLLNHLTSYPTHLLEVKYACQFGYPSLQAEAAIPSNYIEV